MYVFHIRVPNVTFEDLVLEGDTGMAAGIVVQGTPDNSTENITISRCLLNNFGYGIVLENGLSTVMIENCIFTGMYRKGIYVIDFDDSPFHTFSNLRFRCNTIVGGDIGQNDLQVGIDVEKSEEALEIYGNIIYNISFADYTYAIHSDTVSSQGNAIRLNGYYNCGTAPFKIEGLEDLNVEADPQFISMNRQSDDFLRLNQASPFYGRGEIPSSPETDYYGLARDTQSPSWGAVE
jgi:hypothetical protein